MTDQMVQLISHSHHERLLDALWKLRMTRSLCDITVQVDFQGELEEFEAHRVVLAGASGYFKTILLAGKEVKKLFLTDIAPNTFIKFLEYVYSGKMEVDKNCLGNILQVAKLLDCKDLEEACGMPHLDFNSGSVSTGKDETWMEVKKERSKKALKKAIGHHGKQAETERKLALQGRRSSRLAGRRVLVAFNKQKVNQKTKPQSMSPDATLNQDESESTKEEGLQSLRVCETESDVADHQISPETDTLNDSDSDSESAYPFIQDVPEDNVPEASAPAEGMEETGGAEKNGKPVTAKYNCDKCIRSFRYEKSYLKHVKTSHGIQADTTYCCKICQQKFVNRCNLKIHERHVHSDERLFICGVCGKAFKRKKDVTRHMRQVHEGGTGRHYCPICGKSLSSKTALTLHKRTHTGDKPYSCECGARFSQSSALKTHHRTHTGEKPFACDLCDARFTQNHMLAYHKRSHTGEKPFMCENCGKSFASKEYLKHHARIHSGLKPYKCEKCGRAFAQRNSLHQHMKIHTGERPYHCTDCDKQFTQLNALQRHQRIHTGEKPYMCSMCGRTFTDKSTVRRHALTHDKDTPWKNYLVVLQGNVEGRVMKSKGSSLKKEKAGMNSSGEQESLEKQSETKADDTVAVQEEPVTISGDWPCPGTIAVVSHGALGNLTVIQTEVASGTQLQPIMTEDGTSVISLESSTVGIPVTVPFSIPISVAHSISDSASLTVSVPLCEPATASDAILAQTISGPSVATVTDSILAPVEVTLNTSIESVTEQSAEQVEHSDSQQESDHVQPIKAVEAMEFSTRE